MNFDLFMMTALFAVAGLLLLARAKVVKLEEELAVLRRLQPAPARPTSDSIRRA